MTASERTKEYRLRSPSAPSLPLVEAIEKITVIYEREKCHPIALDVLTGILGYKSSTSGSASQAIASLRGYGLLEKIQPGRLRVSKDVERYLFAPDDATKHRIADQWLRTPSLFAELLDQSGLNLSPDALRYELIQRNFSPSTALATMEVFLASAAFVAQLQPSTVVSDDKFPVLPMVLSKPPSTLHAPDLLPEVGKPQLRPLDRIPVRLAGGRRAYIELPQPFLQADKAQLIAQLQVMLTDDQDG